MLIACIYLPNGNPQPGPKFDYKLAWFERLHRPCRRAARSGRAGRARRRLQRRPDRSGHLSDQVLGERRAAAAGEPRGLRAAARDQGWTDAIRTLHPADPMYTFWDYKRDRWPRDAGLRLDHLLLSPPLASRLVRPGSIATSAARPAPAITHPPGSCSAEDGFAPRHHATFAAFG